MTKTGAFEISFQLRSRPRVLPDDEDGYVAEGHGRFPRVTQILALAIYFETLIVCGEAKDYAAVAQLSCLCRERVSQIVRLNYLAPDIQVEILYLPPTTVRYPISETSVRNIASLLPWEDQRAEWVRVKTHHGLVDAPSSPVASTKQS